MQMLKKGLVTDLAIALGAFLPTFSKAHEYPPTARLPSTWARLDAGNELTGLVGYALTQKI